MRFSIRTFGCQMNVYDSDRIRDILMNNGHLPVVDAHEADVLILNTCSVREKPHQKVISAIAQAKAAFPRVRILITGCVAQLEPTILIQAGADWVVGPDHYPRLPEILRADPNTVYVDRADEVPSFLMAHPETMQEKGSVSCFVPIQKGCNNWCAFCVVPAARGPEVSRPLDEILEECRRFLDAGARELFLLGQNVNSVRLPSGFAGLLTRVATLQGVYRVRFTTSHPRDCSPELARVMGSVPAVMPWLHLPIQSGSTRILHAMNRGYTQEHYLNLITLFRREVPEIAFTTDIIVGFPGETNADFEDTLDLVEKVGYEGIYSFVFSPRPGTQAASMPDPVPRDVAAARLEQLQRLHETRLPQILAARYLNRTVEVLVEGASVRNAHHASGRIPQNHVVNFEIPQHHDVNSLRGQRVSVYITDVRTHTLFGRMILD